MYSASQGSLGPNGYSEPLMNIDINRIHKGHKGKAMIEFDETLLQHKGQNESLIGLDETSNTDGTRKAGPDAYEGNCNTDIPQMENAELSAADRAAIEEAQQGTPPALRQTRSKRQKSYAPTCSPNGTELSVKANRKRSKHEAEGLTPSSGSIGNKKKPKTPASSVPDDGGRPKNRTAQNGRMDSSNRIPSIDLINSSDEKDDVRDTRNKVVIADNGLDEAEETSQTIGNEPSGSGTTPGSQSERAESEKDDVNSIDKNGEEEVREGSSAKQSRKNKNKQPNTASSNDGAAPFGDRSSNPASKKNTTPEKKEGQQSLLSSGKSLSSILGPSRYKTYRHVGLPKKHSIPSLHMNRHEPRKERKSIPITFENKKKKGRTDNGSDDEEEEQFKRRDGESEQQFLLRVCDLEGTHDSDKFKPFNDQDDQVMEIEVGTNFDEEEHFDQSGEQEEQ